MSGQIQAQVLELGQGVLRGRLGRPNRCSVPQHFGYGTKRQRGHEAEGAHEHNGPEKQGSEGGRVAGQRSGSRRPSPLRSESARQGQGERRQSKSSGKHGYAGGGLVKRALALRPAMVWPLLAMDEA